MRRHLWWVLGLVLLGAGVALALTSRSEPTDFGWFAYTPLEGPVGQFPASQAYLVSRGAICGAGVAALGLLVLAAGLGYVLGRRRRAEVAADRPEA